MIKATKENFLVVVMGVSGCGKSTVAQALARQQKLEYVEADDFHPAVNKQHMAEGKALNDAMREPWIALLQQHLKETLEAGRDCVLAFSGLRQKHRAKMCGLGGRSIFLHLKGSQSVIAARLAARSDHFMPASLLNSQYLDLQMTGPEEEIIEISVHPPLDEVIAQASAKLTEALEKRAD